MILKDRLQQIHFLRSLVWWFHIRRSGSPQMLFNVNSAPEINGARRALLVYLVRPFLMDRQSSELVVHQAYWATTEIARLLGELGFVVDVVGWNNYYARVGNDYDLLIGFGRAENLAKKASRKTVKIFLSTGSQANFYNQRVKERIAEVKQRRGCDLQFLRYNCDRAAYLEYFDAIVCIGNEVTAATYRPYFKGDIYSWNNHGYDQWIGIPPDKDFDESRSNFLYFASSGQVLRGLDLLLEVFSNRPHLRLFVCGSFEKEKDFVKCFRKELYETPNIVPVGWVPVQSAQYMELIQKCGMNIFPICGGGAPGSVIVCMSQGVIPIVSKEAGMNTDDFGITLPSITVEDIGKAVDWISSQPAEWHEKTTYKVLDAARRDFSQAAFTRRFREILTAVIEDKAVG